MNSQSVIELYLNKSACEQPWITLQYPWNCNDQPKTQARIAVVNDHFLITMKTDEKNIRIAVNEINGPVHTDSCMECFLMPMPQQSKKYFNWEFNASGVLYLSIGTDRFDREKLAITDYRLLFDVKTEVFKTGWQLEFKIPFEYLQRYFPDFNVHTNGRMKINFYKCGDLTEQPHFGSWTKIDLPLPDFHCPDYFGEILFK